MINQIIVKIKLNLHLRSISLDAIVSAPALLSYVAINKLPSGSAHLLNIITKLQINRDCLRLAFYSPFEYF